MAIHITRLNGGNITIGSGGSPTLTEHADTWYKYAGDTEWRTVSISGTIQGDPDMPEPTTQIPNVVNVVDLEIGTDVTSIGYNAFQGAAYIPDFFLTNVIIPNSVTSIAESSFCDCANLTNVTIGNGVLNIAEWGFSSCPKLMQFIVGNGNPNYKAVNGLLLSKDGTTLIAGINGNVTIPNGVTSIRNAAFCGFDGLTSVTIPDSVTSIGKNGFSNCTHLTSVTIGNGVTSIGEHAFAYCYGLTSVTFQGKTLAEVQAMANYPWEIIDTSIINVA